MSRLEGKRALVVGGGTGIGLGVAKMFADEGARVAVVSRRREVLEKACAEIGAGSKAYVCDATDPDQVASAFAAAKTDFGGLDIVVHSAGVQIQRAAIEATEFDAFVKTLEGNVHTAFLVCREAARTLAPGGSIVIIGALAGMVGVPALGTAYSTAKAALTGMLRHMTATLGPRGIRVNMVAPARIPTDLTMVMSPEHEAAALARYPLGRFGDLDDVSYACVYLASEEAKWVTGVVLPLDGGLSVTK